MKPHTQNRTTQSATLSALLATAILPLLLQGCPIYSGELQCHVDEDCDNGYYCSDRNTCLRSTGSGGKTNCYKPSDCHPNETCGQDKICHSGDCSFTPCLYGYKCSMGDHKWECVVGYGGS
ncbi:MAG: hypothetical protein FWD57_05755, partial [Polyangiaceae bacterium]|nr:hypothetical protein [Polyangiaceae bacterium]